MKITFVTDYVCPFCIVGKAALKEAIKELNIDAVIETVPKELTIEPAPRVDTWNDEERKSHYQILFAPAKALGIDAKFPPYVVPRPYTRLAFEGHYFALEQGLDDAYDDTMYRAYFVDELDIGDLNVLADIAEKVGLNREEYIKALEDGRYSEKLKASNHYAKEELNVWSIPTLFIDGELVQFEEYTKEEAIEILKKYM